MMERARVVHRETTLQQLVNCPAAIPRPPPTLYHHHLLLYLLTVPTAPAVEGVRKAAELETALQTTDWASIQINPSPTTSS